MSLDPLSIIDIELVEIARTPVFDVTRDNLELMRRAPGLPSLPGPPFVERTIAGPSGEALRIFVTDPAPGRKGRAGVLHLHSGGFVMGSAATETPLAQAIAGELGHVVVSVDYTLAPEAPFPQALNENLAALTWMHDNAEDLGIDRDRIGLFGISGGGGHATMLALAARDQGGPAIACLVMNYPMLDDRTGSSRTAAAATGNFIWTRGSNIFGWTSLLGQAAGGDNPPEGAVPARIEDLTGMPRTYIGIGGADLFVEEGVAFAGRLIAAGVSTELLVVPGAYHAFDLIAPAAAVSSRFTASWISALRNGLKVRS